MTDHAEVSADNPRRIARDCLAGIAEYPPVLIDVIAYAITSYADAQTKALRKALDMATVAGRNESVEVASLRSALKTLDESHEEDKAYLEKQRDQVVQREIDRINECDELRSQLAEAEKKAAGLSEELRVANDTMSLFDLFADRDALKARERFKAERDAAFKRGQELMRERAAMLHESVRVDCDHERQAGHPGAAAMGTVIDYRDQIRALQPTPQGEEPKP